MSLHFPLAAIAWDPFAFDTQGIPFSISTYKKGFLITINSLIFFPSIKVSFFLLRIFHAGIYVFFSGNFASLHDHLFCKVRETVVIKNTALCD